MINKNTTDLRVIKTREAIYSAIKEMICEMDASDITIKKLAERARIHRKTFYLHYTCMEALFEDLLEQLIMGYKKAIDKIPVDAPFTEINRVFFEYMGKQEPYVEKLICSPDYQNFCNSLFLATKNYNRSKHNPYSSYSTEEQNIIDTYLCITSINIYRQWIMDNKKVPLDKLIDISGSLLTNGVSSIL